MLKRKKFLIGGIILLLAFAYLGFTGFRSSATYYYTVSEFVEQEDSINDKVVRVNGQVAPGSVVQEPGEFTLRFSIAGGGESIPVVYQGVVPDSFKAGSNIVIEGSLDSVGTFQAKTLMMKCPSKYVPQ